MAAHALLPSFQAVVDNLSSSIAELASQPTDRLTEKMMTTAHFQLQPKVASLLQVRAPSSWWVCCRRSQVNESYAVQATCAGMKSAQHDAAILWKADEDPTSGVFSTTVQGTRDLAEVFMAARDALVTYLSALPSHHLAIATSKRFGDSLDAAVAAVMGREAKQVAMVEGMDERIQQLATLTTQAVSSVRSAALNTSGLVSVLTNARLPHAGGPQSGCGEPARG